MKTFLRIFLLSALSIFLVAGTATAITLGTNITISDNVYTDTGWYSDREDQEVEPNCATGQAWDLEGFFLDGTMLTMVGGYDFENGQGVYQSGDIFIDTDGDAKYGPDNHNTGGGNAVVANSFGYDYALRLNFLSTGNTYSVYGLTGASTVKIYYGQNEESNPWQYAANASSTSDPYSFTFYENQSDSDVGELLGGTHYAVALNLTNFLTQDEIDHFTAHFTYRCGNDNLMGRNPVPEPATMLLFGTGLVGLAGFGRKKLFKK